MSNIQSLANAWHVNREVVRQFIWACVEEGIIPTPERGGWNNLILPEETKRVLSKMWLRRRQEVSIVASLAKEFHISHEAVRTMIWRLVERGIISQLQKVKGKIFLSVLQTMAFRNYRWQTEGKSPVTALAEEMGFSKRYILVRIHKLAEEGKIPPLKKQRRGGRTELVFDPRKVREELTKGAG